MFFFYFNSVLYFFCFLFPIFPFSFSHSIWHPHIIFCPQFSQFIYLSKNCNACINWWSLCIVLLSPIHSTSLEMSEVSSETDMLSISVPQQTDAAISRKVLQRYAKSFYMFTNIIMYFKYPGIQFWPLFSLIHPTFTIKLHFKAVSSILTKLL